MGFHICKMNNTLQKHWEQVYQTKTPEQVSWTQTIPSTSLSFIQTFGVDKSAPIIDIGGGDSKLVDYLLLEGYENITVLDISATAIKRAQNRVGDTAGKVKWVVSDIMSFSPEQQYSIWHDRATFHFLTTRKEIAQYLDIARKAVNGYLTIGTFSDEGPDKCSGLPVHQYSEESLSAELKNGFSKIRCITEDHITPFQTRQHFLFCSFRKQDGPVQA